MFALKNEITKNVITENVIVEKTYKKITIN